MIRRNIKYAILAFILWGALVVRLYKIDNPIADWHSWRQADTASVTRTYVQNGINLLLPKYHDISTTQTGVFNPQGYRFVEFPLFNAIHAFLVLNIPLLSLEVWGRLLSIFSAVISTLIIFFLGKRFISTGGGILAAFFYAFIPFNIYFTRVILPEPMSVTLALLSIMFFAIYTDKKVAVYLYLSSVLFAISMLIKPFTFFYIVPIVYLAIKRFGLAGLFKTKKLLFAIDLALIPFFLWRIWINQYPQGIPHFWWAFNGDNIRFKPSFWRWIFGERLGHLILGGWGLIPFSFGILSLKRGRGFIYAFLLGMFLYVVIFATANVRHDYYQIMIIPAVSLCLAMGTIGLWEAKQFSKWVSRSLVIFCLLVMFVTGTLQVREFYKINHPEIIEAGIAVDRLVPYDALVIAPYNGDTAFLYQTKRWGWPYVDRPLKELIANGADYFVSVNLADGETQEVIKQYKVVEQTPVYVIADLNKSKL